MRWLKHLDIPDGICGLVVSKRGYQMLCQRHLDTPDGICVLVVSRRGYSNVVTEAPRHT